MQIAPHINVVAFCGFSLEHTLYVQEFVGEYLFEFLHVNTLSDSTRLKFLTDIAQGMEHLEKNSIVHGDLATRNIQIDKNYNRCQISDYGVGVFVESDLESQYQLSNEGPTRWKSPEALINKEFTHKSDVWAFGIVWLEILTKLIPYPELEIKLFKIAFEKGEIRPTKYVSSEPNETFRTLLKKIFSEKKRRSSIIFTY